MTHQLSLLGKMIGDLRAIADSLETLLNHPDIIPLFIPGTPGTGMPAEKTKQRRPCLPRRPVLLYESIPQQHRRDDWKSYVEDEHRCMGAVLLSHRTRDEVSCWYRCIHQGTWRQEFMMHLCGQHWRQATIIGVVNFSQLSPEEKDGRYSRAKNA